MSNKTYIETYKMWDLYFCESRGRFYAYDTLEVDKCSASNEFLSELYRTLDKLWLSETE